QIAALAHGFQQALGHDERRVFAGLRQQDHKLIAAIAEGKVDQPQVRLDEVPDLRQQLRSYQVAVRVVHRLEVVQVNEDDAELMPESRRAVDFRFQRFVQMPRVVQAGAVICDGQLLNALYRLGVFNGY